MVMRLCGDGVGIREGSLDVFLFNPVKEELDING